MMMIMTNDDYCFKKLHIAIGLEIQVESFHFSFIVVKIYSIMISTNGFPTGVSSKKNKHCLLVYILTENLNATE